MPAPQSVIVVGGGVGGFAAVQALRNRGYAGRLTLVNPEGIPYDRPPLSKGYLAGTQDAEAIAQDAFVKACILRTENLDGEPVPNEWSAWADEMTNGQWEEVLRACFKLTNEGEPVFPQ